MAPSPQPSSSTPASRWVVYAGIFAVACASLMLEILLTRVISVISWYHLAFFVISLAMLGMTAGAVFVFVRPAAFEPPKVPAQLARYCTWFAASTPLAAALALSMPLVPVRTFMDFCGLLAFGAALAVPFVFAGVVLTLALTRAGLRPAIAYGVDLVGAALGCGLVIPLLAVFDAPSGVLVAAAMAALAGLAFASAAGRRRRGPALLALALMAAAMFNRSPADTMAPLRPAWVKGLREDPEPIAWTRWNTYSRVTVDETVERPPVLWAQNRKMPAELRAPISQRTIEIDGAAATMMAADATALETHAYLDWDVTSFAHRLRPTGPAAVIGVGGGRDLLAARRAGHESVVGVELNQLIVDLHEREMRDFAKLVDLPGVELVSDEARSWFTRTDQRFSVIAMSLIDTWASTGAGAYSLSENGLYTVDAWGIFYDRLADDGLFTVSRWWHPSSPGETGRMIGLAMELLWARGVEDPRRHLFVVQSDSVATLLLSKGPLSEADVDKLQSEAVRLGFNMLATPRKAPSTAPGRTQLNELWTQPDRASFWAWARAQSLDLTPATDDRPFFFNMLRPGDWFRDKAEVDAMDVSFLGNLQATQTLVYATLVSLLLTLLTVLWPLRRRAGDMPNVARGDLIAACSYFALIGLGFMFVEIGLLSRLNVLLGHPTLSLAVLLGGIILFTGIGSLLSDRAKLSSRGFGVAYPLIPAALAGVAAIASGPALASLSGAETPVRVLAGLALVAVPALGMGLGFPFGLRLVGRISDDPDRPALGPWLWGINGAFGVCASGLALGSSMVWGVPTTLAIGCACYLALLPCTRKLWRASVG